MHSVVLLSEPMSLSKTALRLSAAVPTLSPHDEDALYLIVWQLQGLLEDKALSHIHRAGSSACLVSYVADATPLKVAWRHTQSCPSSLPTTALRVQSSQKLDIYMQRYCVKTLGPSGFEVSIVPIPPVPLEKGKSSWHMYNATLRSLNTVSSSLRSQSGIKIIHLCYDRGAVAVARKYAQHRKLETGVRAADQGQESHSPESLKELLVYTGCAVHDTHNALKWAMSGYVSDISALSMKVHNMVEKLLKVVPALHENITPFLTERLRFHRNDNDDPNICAEFWKCLGVGSDWLHLFETFDPHSDGQYVFVHERAKSEDDFVGQLAAMLVYGMRYRKHVDTRWLSVGASARGLLLSMSCGLQLSSHRSN